MEEITLEKIYRKLEGIEERLKRVEEIKLEGIDKEVLQTKTEMIEVSKTMLAIQGYLQKLNVVLNHY